MTATPEEAAVLGAINALYPTRARAFLYGDPAVASLTTDHILVMIVRRYTDGQMISGDERVRGGQLITRYVAKRADNIPDMNAAVEAAVEAKTLLLAGGGEVGPFKFQSSEPPGPDDGWVSGDTFYTF